MGENVRLTTLLHDAGTFNVPTTLGLEKQSGVHIDSPHRSPLLAERVFHTS